MLIWQFPTLPNKRISYSIVIIITIIATTCITPFLIPFEFLVLKPSATTSHSIEQDSTLTLTSRQSLKKGYNGAEKVVTFFPEDSIEDIITSYLLDGDKQHNRNLFFSERNGIEEEASGSDSGNGSDKVEQVVRNPHLSRLLTCAHKPNPITGHIRLPNQVGHISLLSALSRSQQATTKRFSHEQSGVDTGRIDQEQSQWLEQEQEQVQERQRDNNEEKPQMQVGKWFNPTLIPLPYWSVDVGIPTTDSDPVNKKQVRVKARYLLVSRKVTSGLHQESWGCWADFCLHEDLEDVEDEVMLGDNDQSDEEEEERVEQERKVFGGQKLRLSNAEVIPVNLDGSTVSPSKSTPITSVSEVTENLTDSTEGLSAASTVPGEIFEIHTTFEHEQTQQQQDNNSFRSLSSSLEVSLDLEAASARKREVTEAKTSTDNIKSQDKLGSSLKNSHAELKPNSKAPPNSKPKSRSNIKAKAKSHTKFCRASSDRNLQEQGIDNNASSGTTLTCLATPFRLSLPPTPALHCSERWTAFPHIPGFHDPRIFYSGIGEPLMIVNSASTYGCVGLWVVDLRSVVLGLEALLLPSNHHGGHLRGKHSSGGSSDTNCGYGLGVIRRFEGLVELTRRHPDRDAVSTSGSRKSGQKGVVEKNWLLFFPSEGEAYVQYDAFLRKEKKEGNTEVVMISNSTVIHRSDDKEVDGGNVETASETNMEMDMEMGSSLLEQEFNRSSDNSSTQTGGRTVAKHIGNGYTTSNLTAPLEQSCFTYPNSSIDPLGKQGHWHQGTNSLRLILCTRSQIDDGTCPREHKAQVAQGYSVHIAVAHRKFTNEMDLPMRYERYIMMWESHKPFRMLGVSRWPILWGDERARPWSEEENWLNETSTERSTKQTNFAHHVKQEHDSAQKDSHEARTESTGSKKSGKNNVWLKSQRPWSARAETKGRLNAYFTYTPSLAWAWRDQMAFELSTTHNAAHAGFEDEVGFDHLASLGTGYLDDDIIVGIGLDDVDQGYVRTKGQDLVSCLRLCPGVVVD